MLELFSEDAELDHLETNLKSVQASVDHLHSSELMQASSVL